LPITLPFSDILHLQDGGVNLPVYAKLIIYTGKFAASFPSRILSLRRASFLSLREADFVTPSHDGVKKSGEGGFLHCKAAPHPIFSLKGEGFPGIPWPKSASA
jgi:hypothetical protein